MHAPVGSSSTATRRVALAVLTLLVAPSALTALTAADSGAVASGDAEGLIVHAGDSRFVRQGQSVTLSAHAAGDAGDVAYAWDTDGDGAPDVAGPAIEVDTSGMPIGPHTFTVFASDATGASGSDTVTVLVYEFVVHRHAFSEDVLVAVNDEDLGASGLVDASTYRYEIEVPPGAESLEAFLTWERYLDVVPPNLFGIDGGPNDFDLYAFNPDGAQVTYSADLNRPEELRVGSPAAGTWVLEVRSYLVALDTFTLLANVTAAPPSPIPAVTQESSVCFSTPTQTLAVSATAAAPELVTGAWDLDGDGRFDDATGLTTTTSFAEGAHLVGFRATTTSGYRTTILVAVKIMDECPQAPSVVVVAVADTGINPYHKDFLGEFMPYPELVALTTAKEGQIGQADAPVRHKTTGEILPFTRHPSTYIPGFPANAPAIELTLGDGFNKAADNAAVWNRGHDAIPLQQWMWIPGTKIVGAIDWSDVAPVNGRADTTPLYDDDGHGTSASSVAVGNLNGACPRCVLAFAEALSGDGAFFDKSWIDFVSVSGGTVGNAGFPDAGQFGFEDATRRAAERGQTISYAAGNGNENAFVTPQQTYLSNSLGPDWTINVGAVRRISGGDSVILGTGKPVDWSSYGSGSIPSACRANYAGTCNFGGTSAATPIATGYMADALLNARIALGDEEAGQKPASRANGKLQAVAVGTPVTESKWLEDGVLTRAELWHVAFHCASPFGGFVIGYPAVVPTSDVDYAYGGYGIADKAMSTCATTALVAGGAVRATPDADQFFEHDEQIRDALWGDWDGDGDGTRGGNFNSL